MINENRLFKLIPYFFSKPEKVLYEIAQNASRANATNLDITVANGKLTASDNGTGAQHAEPLFVLADTGWDNSVEPQMPAGWGVYFIIAVSSEVTFRSLFGSVTLDCKKFLEDKAYRESLLGKVNRADTAEGFHVEADLNDKLPIDPMNTRLGYFPLHITVNGNTVEKSGPGSHDHTVITSSYEGNQVEIYRNIFGNSDIKSIDMACIWYGIPIGQTRYNNDLLINVTEGTPMTPVLPYREDIKKDERLERFTRWVRELVASHCVAYINDPTNGDHYELVRRMRYLSNCGTQEELDRLTRFYCKEDQPYHHLRVSFSSLPGEKMINKGDYVESESLELEINSHRIDWEASHSQLFLPENTLIVRTLPDRAPSWAKIHQKGVQVSIRTKGKPYQGNYEWHDSSIACKGKDITVVGIIQYYDCGGIYYAKSPDNFDDIQKTVFETIAYSEESDSYDSQESYFDDQINEDIMNIRQTYSLPKLLEGFYTAKINPWDITSILYKRGTKTITVTTEKKAQARNGRKDGADKPKKEKHVLRVA